MVRRRPSTRSEYASDDLARVRATCLEVAWGLGDLMDAMTVVGGLAPYLLVPPERLPAGEEHVGTLDLDLGLTLATGAQLYDEVSAGLRRAGFAPEGSPGEGGFRWRYPSSGEAQAWLDVIPDGEVDGRPPWLPQIRFAFRRRQPVKLEGLTLGGKQVSKALWVCDAAAFSSRPSPSGAACSRRTPTISTSSCGTMRGGFLKASPN